ncbi:hypothetical protein [Sporosarcina sp. HYO08]|uniref:hypothetical protein n=1 Tax=Sporosarcina sp. HYO08 TaxID=1759557 RepID=UPI00079BF410|nr:hypothetical protein [Sporosarcina sp. HYO08]KXH79747.1 hypothetical protein AU377_09655 [Sporosarcina sp. HYO08]
MTVTRYYIIGNLSVSSSWIALIAAFIFAYIAVRIRYGRKLAAVVSDMFFYLIIIWKLSVIITNFSSVIRSPLAIIYFHGGMVGFSLGLLVVIGKTLYHILKGQLQDDGLLALLTGAVLAQAFYQMMMVFLNDGGLVASVMTILLFGGFAVFFWRFSNQGGVWPFQLTMLLMAVHIFAAAFQPEGVIGKPLISTFVIVVFFAFIYLKGHHFMKRSEEHL